MFRFAITVAVLVSAPVATFAQTQADTLGTCLADNTSGKDRKDLATWVFIAIAAHPDIKQYASARVVAQADESSRTMGALVTRLLTESCAKETRAILENGGTTAFEVAFGKLGQVAMQELMTDKAVGEQMSIFQRYMDKKRFEDLAAGK